MCQVKSRVRSRTTTHHDDPTVQPEKNSVEWRETYLALVTRRQDSWPTFRLGQRLIFKILLNRHSRSYRFPCYIPLEFRVAPFWISTFCCCCCCVFLPRTELFPPPPTFLPAAYQAITRWDCNSRKCVSRHTNPSRLLVGGRKRANKRRKSLGIKREIYVIHRKRE